MIVRASLIAIAALPLLTGVAAAQGVRVESPLSRLYGGADYLLWFPKDAPLSVPLVSTGPESNFNGFLVNSNSTILYGAPFAPASGGNDTQSFSGMSGGRLTVGYMLDPARGLAVEASGFGLQSQEAGYALSSNGSGITSGYRVPVYNAVPYFISVPVDAAPGENGLPIALPNRIGGGISITNRISLWGLEGVGVYELARGTNWKVSGLGGLRYLDLIEDFDLVDAFYGTGGPFLGQSGVTQDHFGTRNRFIGPMLGARAEANWGPFSVQAQARLALGDTVQDLSISGSYRAVNYTPASGSQGIFAQPNNSGRRSADRFSVAPDFQIKVGYDITPMIRVSIGYDFLYMSSVVRPTDQIDRNIPKGNVFNQGGVATVTTGTPGRLFRTTDFYAQGLTAGVSFRF